MKLFSFIGTGAFILLSAFVTGHTTTDQPSLYNIKWSLKKIHSDTTVEMVMTKAFIKFDKEKKSAGGNGSCNVFGGSATINGNEMTITNIFSTKMYCEGVQQTEDAFFKQLGKVDRYEIKGKILSLYKGKDLLLEFEAID